MILVHTLDLLVPLSRMPQVGEAAHALGCKYVAEGVNPIAGRAYVGIRIESEDGLDRRQLDMVMTVAEGSTPKASGPQCHRCKHPVVDDSYEVDLGGRLVHRTCPVGGVEVTD